MVFRLVLRKFTLVKEAIVLRVTIHMQTVFSETMAETLANSPTVTLSILKVVEAYIFIYISIRRYVAGFIMYCLMFIFYLGLKLMVVSR